MGPSTDGFRWGGLLALRYMLLAVLGVVRLSLWAPVQSHRAKLGKGPALLDFHLQVKDMGRFRFYVAVVQ